MIASRAPLPESSASEPSGLKIRRRATKPGASGGESSSTPSAPGPAWRSQSLPHRRRREREAELGGLHDQVVVAERLPLLEPHRAHHARRGVAARRALCTACATSPRVAAGDVDRRRARQLAQPRELALGVAARAPLHAPRRRRAAAPRSRAPGAPTATRRPRRRGAPPRRLPPRPSPRRGRRSGGRARRAPSRARPAASGGGSRRSRAARRRAAPRPRRAARARASRAGRRCARSRRRPRDCARAGRRAARARRRPRAAARSARGPAGPAAGAGRARRARRAGRGRSRRRRADAGPAAIRPSISACARRA